MIENTSTVVCICKQRLTIKMLLLLPLMTASLANDEMPPWGSGFPYFFKN